MQDRLINKVQNVARRILGPTLSSIEQETARVNIPPFHGPENPLLRCSARYFSQNDEDGIVIEILRRIGLTKPGTFLEFGVENGTECNTIILLAMGWCGGWAGGEPIVFDLPKGARLGFCQGWITAANASDVAKRALSPVDRCLSDVQIASIDLDGNDGPIARSLLNAGLRPDLFILEYNAKFPPPLEFEMPYDQTHVWRGADYQGVALQTWSNMLTGYRLVACNENGVNAFFVSDTHSGKFSDVPSNPADLFRIGHYRRTFPRSGHPTTPETVRHLATRQVMQTSPALVPSLGLIDVTIA